MTDQNSISVLPKLTTSYRYENFLNVYQDSDNVYFYNLLRNINIFPASNSSLEDTYTTNATDTWYSISYKYYNTMDLWWLVCDYNQIKDPTKLPETGTRLKLLKPDYVSTVINNLINQINN
jgi:LysM repeat protein